LIDKLFAVVEVFVLANGFVIVFEVLVRFDIAIAAISIHIVDIAIPSGIVQGIAQVAYAFLYLALDLLGSAFHLGPGIASPLAGLTFDPARSVIDDAFDFVGIHASTSVVSFVH
jgi:hypothetical protein